MEFSRNIKGQEDAISFRDLPESGRRWKFGDCEYVEIRRQLLVRGELAKLESKPLEVVIDDGDIVTAGGMTAWTDLGLRLIQKLMGSAVALETAKYMLLDPSGREQSFYKSFLPRFDHGDVEILKVQHWLQKNGCRNVDLSKMAKKSGLELRTFMRRFQKATTLRPTEYCQHLRIGKARGLLESTKKPVEKISWEVGYEDPASFRKVFQKVLGLSPREYRKRFAIGC